MLKYKDKQFDRILTERELEQEWIYGEYDEDFDDWIQALIKEEEIELIMEER